VLVGLLVDDAGWLSIGFSRAVERIMIHFDGNESEFILGKAGLIH
jgi:hypothetical protein